MPAFSTRAKSLAAGLAAQHGMAFAEPPAAAPDEAKARLGAQLLGADGFNCTACHAVGAQSASAPFGAPGVDFTRVATRVRPEFFQRWLDDPQRITPGSKMPKFTASDGRSTRPDVLGGEAHAQWAAIYDYLRKISP